MAQTGIYIIKSIIKPERFYVGSAGNIGRRWSSHLATAKQNKHRSPILQNHVNKYGIEDLEFSILEECTMDTLLTREQYYIDTLHPFFNVLKIAGSPRGCKHSEEFSRKLSLRLKGHVTSEETRRKISEAHKGKKISEEAKAKMSIARKGNKNSLGRKASDETRKKLSASRIGNTYGRFLKGIKRSEETKKKMSEARTKWHMLNKMKKVS